MVFGILNKVRGNLGLGQEKVRGSAGSASPVTYEISDFMAGNVSMIADTEIIVGEVIVKPQRELAFGYNDTSGFSENQGTIYLDLKDTTGTPVDLNGEVILSVADYENDRNDVVFRGSVSDLRSGATDITKRIKFPLKNPDNRGFAGYNDKLVMKFKSTTTATLSLANSTAKISGTSVKTSL
jgi:hypothetical protein